jgi:hypothetical protein
MVHMDNVGNRFRNKILVFDDMIRSLRDNQFYHHNKSLLEGACFQTPSQTAVVSNLSMLVVS